ncbi:hypothetical protein ACWDNT_14400 [Streptomyces sp. NPDC000963]
MAVETRVPDDDCEALTGWGRTAPTLARWAVRLRIPLRTPPEVSPS